MMVDDDDGQVKIIKTTQTPIICICNDRDSPKVKTLASSCYDLVFQRPTPYVDDNGDE